MADEWHWWYWLVIASGFPTGLGLGFLCKRLMGGEEE